MEWEQIELSPLAVTVLNDVTDEGTRALMVKVLQLSVAANGDPKFRDQLFAVAGELKPLLTPETTKLFQEAGYWQFRIE